MEGNRGTVLTDPGEKARKDLEEVVHIRAILRRGRVAKANLPLAVERAESEPYFSAQSTPMGGEC